MAVGLIDKLANFIMPIEESAEPQDNNVVHVRSKSSHLRVHANYDELKIVVISPLRYEDVRSCANQLKAGMAVLVNFQHVDDSTKQSMNDFLDGVCYVIGGLAEKISSDIKLYTPEGVGINKELYGYSIPTYVKQNEVL